MTITRVGSDEDISVDKRNSVPFQQQPLKMKLPVLIATFALTQHMIL